MAGVGADVHADAVDTLQGAAAWETNLVIGGGASEMGLGHDDLAALRDWVPALGVLAGYKVCSPEEEPDDGSFHLGGLATSHGGSADGGDDGGRLGDGGGG